MAKIKCNHCGDIIIGDKKGTYIECSCGKCAIDETPDYFRIIGNFEDYEVIEPKEIKEEVEMETEDEKIWNDVFKYQKIFNYFGYENQRRKLTEEVQELNDEILLYEKGIGDINKIIEEMADLRNILLGFILEYDIHSEEINNIMETKLDRTIERINSGYYGTGKRN